MHGERHGGGPSVHRSGKLKAILCFVISFVLLAIGLEGLSEGLGFRREAARADGIVVDTVHGGSHPMIRFALPSGKTVDYNQNGFIGGYRTGEHVQVLYDPVNPRGTACVNTIGGLLGGFAFVFGFSLMTLFAGLMMLVLPT